MAQEFVRVTKYVRLQVWYDRGLTIWVGRYVDENGDQVGDSWSDNTRDGILVMRPRVPILI